MSIGKLSLTKKDKKMPTPTEKTESQIREAYLQMVFDAYGATLPPLIAIAATKLFRKFIECKEDGDNLKSVAAPKKGKK